MLISRTTSTTTKPPIKVTVEDSEGYIYTTPKKPFELPSKYEEFFFKNQIV